MLASRNSAESAGDPPMVMKLWLIVSGIYIWEIVTTLDFEWSVIRRHRRYLWTIWIYSISRLSGLAVIILVLANLYADSPVNCQAWVTAGWGISALGYGLSSVLIMLRMFVLIELSSYAIWDKSKVIMAISGATWVINLGFQLAGVVKIRAEWLTASRTCTVTNIQACRNFYINLLATDVILLITMLAGLLRLRRGGGGGSFYLSLLWKQGVIWLIIATAAELPQVLLLFLNVNDSLNFLFLVPSIVAIIIAATRMYRFLIYSASPPDVHFIEPDSPNLQKTKRLVSHSKVSSVVHIPSNRLEVTVHRAYHEEYSMSQTNHNGSDDNVEGRDENE